MVIVAGKGGVVLKVIAFCRAAHGVYVAPHVASDKAAGHFILDYSSTNLLGGPRNFHHPGVVAFRGADACNLAFAHHPCRHEIICTTAENLVLHGLNLNLVVVLLAALKILGVLEKVFCLLLVRNAHAAHILPFVFSYCQNRPAG